MANGLTAILEKYGSVVLFDVETSGLNPYKDQIIELAAQKLYRKEDGLVSTSKSTTEPYFSRIAVNPFAICSLPAQ